MLMFALVACGTSEIEDTRTIDHFLQAFEDAGYEVVNPESMGSASGAIDSVIFEIVQDHDVVVTIYQFDNEEALVQAQRAWRDTVRNGMFLINSSRAGPELREFFASIK